MDVLMGNTIELHYGKCMIQYSCFKNVFPVRTTHHQTLSTNSGSENVSSLEFLRV